MTNQLMTNQLMTNQLMVRSACNTTHKAILLFLHTFWSASFLNFSIPFGLLVLCLDQLTLLEGGCLTSPLGFLALCNRSTSLQEQQIRHFDPLIRFSSKKVNYNINNPLFITHMYNVYSSIYADGKITKL